jgi:hypothetical protein
MIEKNEITQGFEILKLSTTLYAKNPISFDALGEAYFKIGDVESAKLNFQKSYDLDSSSLKSKQMLLKISKILAVPEEILSTYIGKYTFDGIPLNIIKDNEIFFFEFAGAKSAMDFTSNTNCITFGYDFNFTKDKEGNVDGFNLLGNKKAIKIK